MRRNIFKNKTFFLFLEYSNSSLSKILFRTRTVETNFKIDVDYFLHSVRIALGGLEKYHHQIFMLPRSSVALKIYAIEDWHLLGL